MIGIMAAHPAEIATLVDKATVRETQTILRKEFHIGELCGHDVVITTCGIGKVRAAARTQFLIDHFQVSRLIFSGVAGALDPQLKRGDIVISTQTIEHDFDVGEGSAGERRRLHWYDADPQLVELAMKAGEKAGLADSLRPGKVLTGDQAITQLSRKQALWQSLGGSCVEMEGAAVAGVCWMNQVPFVLVRGISDMADESASGDFLRWFQIAAQRAASLVVEMVRSLPPA